MVECGEGDRMIHAKGFQPVWPRNFSAIAILGLTSMLLGCTAGNIASSLPETPQNNQITPNLGQTLPIEATIAIGDRTFDLEVARSVEQQRLGLMFREPLPENQGMLFPFDPPRPASFWMYNVTFPLDIIFMSEGKILYIEASVPGCAKLPCPGYGPERTVSVDSVLELNGGTAEEIGLEEGDEVELEWLE